MQFDDADIHAITVSVWQAMLDLEVEPCPPPEASAMGILVGCVAIEGAWHGTMTVECPLPLACRVGAIMFGVAPDAATRAHAEDAMSEITNMIGGNLKSLLPEPCQLLFPRVSSDVEGNVGAPGRRIARVGFACGPDVFLVSINEDQASVAADAPQ